MASPALRRAPSGLAALALLLAAGLSSVCAWKVARATWYDDAAWMSVHDGSCMYGRLGGRFGGEQNWHVGALQDGHQDYQGSCGRCYEMKCDPAVFKDNFGNSIDRTSDCQNMEPVQIKITDTCPCEKPENAYSNKRWCCNDMDHFDIGIWAFRKFADPGKGVVQVKYQEIVCPDWLRSELSDVQKPSSLRTQYPWALAEKGYSSASSSSSPSSSPPSTSPSPSPSPSSDKADKGVDKVISFSGPPESDNGQGGSPPPSPSPSPSPSPAPSPDSSNGHNGGSDGGDGGNGGR